MKRPHRRFWIKVPFIGRMVELLTEIRDLLLGLLTIGERIMAQIDDLNAAAKRIADATDKLVANPPQGPDLTPAVASLTSSAVKLEALVPAVSPETT